MSIRQRGLALLAACAILTMVVLGAVSTASAQDVDYTAPNSVQNPGVNPPKIGVGTSGEGLARTGSNSTIPAAELAIVLMVAGGFLLILGRKRAERSRVPATS